VTKSDVTMLELYFEYVSEASNKSIQVRYQACRLVNIIEGFQHGEEFYIPAEEVIGAGRFLEGEERMAFNRTKRFILAK